MALSFVPLRDSSTSLGMTGSPKIFVRHWWKSLEFSKEPLNIRYDEPGRLRVLSWQKAPDRLNKCST